MTLDRASLRIALCTTLAAGCSSVPEARVAETVPSALVAGSDVERYELQAEHMAVEAEVSAGKSYTLVFPKGRGTLSVSPSRPESSTVSLHFDMASATSTPQLAADVAKNRFLHADRFPSASIESRSMKRGAEGLELWLDFTIHGTKKTLVMPATVELSTCRAKLACEFAFDRQTYGIIDTGSLDSLVSDTVVVRATIDVARKSAPASCAAKPSSG